MVFNIPRFMVLPKYHSYDLSNIVHMNISCEKNLASTMNERVIKFKI